MATHSCVIRHLHPYKVPHVVRQRFPIPRSGDHGDGGYVVPVQQTMNCDVFHCLGVGNGTPLEQELNRQMPDKTIHLYDSINPTLGRWYDGVNNAHLHIKEVTSLDEIIQKRDQNIFLKMDVEGAEWPLLDNVSEDLLERVDVFVAELHGFHEVQHIEMYDRILRKVNRHFTPIHIHGNNYGWLFEVNNAWFPVVVEMTYLNNRFTKGKVLSDEKFPTPIDVPNTIDRADFAINAPQVFCEEPLARP
jgi:hypothetical protein